MTAKILAKLLEHIHQQGYVTRNSSFSSEARLGLSNPRVEAYAQAYRSPSFGWAAMFFLANRRKPFPAWLAEHAPSLFRVYCYTRDEALYRDDDVETLLMMNTPAYATDRALLEALLICRNCDFELISRETGMSISAISLYHDACFNVRHRFSEAAFVRGLVYPDGRLTEITGNSLRTEAFSQILLRAGYNNSVDDVLYFAGSVRGLLDAAADSAGKFEKTLMVHGAILARNGGIHDSRITAVQMAKSMLQAKAIGGGDTGIANAEAQGMGAMVMGQIKRVREVREATLRQPVELQAAALVSETPPIWKPKEET